MAAEVYGSLKPLEFKGIIEILQRTCLRHNRVVSEATGAAPLLPPVTGALPACADPQLSWRGGNSPTAPQRTCPSVHPLPMPKTSLGDSPKTWGEHVAQTGLVYMDEHAEDI